MIFSANSMSLTLLEEVFFCLRDGTCSLDGELRPSAAKVEGLCGCYKMVNKPNSHTHIEKKRCVLTRPSGAKGEALGCSLLGTRDFDKKARAVSLPTSLYSFSMST